MPPSRWLSLRTHHQKGGSQQNNKFLHEDVTYPFAKRNLTSSPQQPQPQPQQQQNGRQNSLRSSNSVDGIEHVQQRRTMPHHHHNHYEVSHRRHQDHESISSVRSGDGPRVVPLYYSVRTAEDPEFSAIERFRSRENGRRLTKTNSASDLLRISARRNRCQSDRSHHNENESLSSLEDDSTHRSRSRKINNCSATHKSHPHDHHHQSAPRGSNCHQSKSDTQSHNHQSNQGNSSQSSGVQHSAVIAAVESSLSGHSYTNASPKEYQEIRVDQKLVSSHVNRHEEAESEPSPPAVVKVGDELHQALDLSPPLAPSQNTIAPAWCQQQWIESQYQPIYSQQMSAIEQERNLIMNENQHLRHQLTMLQRESEEMRMRLARYEQQAHCASSLVSGSSPGSVASHNEVIRNLTMQLDRALQELALERQQHRHETFDDQSY